MDLYSIVPVSDRSKALGWFEAFFGRPADVVIGEEYLWQVGENAWVVVDDRDQRAEGVGRAMITFGVTDLDEIVARLAAHGISHEPVEIYSNGARHVVVLDPDGNSLSLAQARPMCEARAALAGPATVRESITVPASADAVFALLTDPARHYELDGSQMLRGPAGSDRIAAVGDTFLMRMWLEPIGDYVMLNRVLAYEDGRLIIWEPTPGDPVSSRHAELPIGASQGYWWGFELAEAGDDGTVVTEMFDCSRADPGLRANLSDGEVWRPVMAETLGRLAAAVTGAA